MGGSSWFGTRVRPRADMAKREGRHEGRAAWEGRELLAGAGAAYCYSPRGSESEALLPTVGGGAVPSAGPMACAQQDGNRCHGFATFNPVTWVTHSDRGLWLGVCKLGLELAKVGEGSASDEPTLGGDSERSERSEPSEDTAEREGFEPPDPCESAVFKTAAFVHSATAPSRSSHTRYAPRSTRRGG
jgi:hypothetical protein